MSTQQIISVADLTGIQRSLQVLSEGVSGLNNQVGHIGGEIAVTQRELAALQQAFADYVAADARAKELQLAETRQVKVRQELENKFGYYAQVRRHATGILQAADVRLVREETIAAATEELMLAAPGYWLAPALVALAGWLRDERELSEKAIAEASRRDDEKTSLFFALISRRAGRLAACRLWLDRYFAMQDPARLDRQAVVLVDALASGVFGSEVRRQCSTRLEEWVKELGQQPTFIAEQRKQWAQALLSKAPAQDHSKQFPYLSKHSKTWPELNQSLNNAGVHDAILSHLRTIFEGVIAPSPTLEAAVDELLDKLVSRFDDEELPLRRAERLLDLVIAEDGNRAAAQVRFDMESKSLDEEVSFTQLLTNAAMHPETSHASLATQRLAIAGSRQWIKDAHADITATARTFVPQKLSLKIEEWEGETTDGANEAQLLSSAQTHLTQLKNRELEKLQVQFQHWAAVGIGGLLALWGLFTLSILTMAIGAGAIIWFFAAKSGMEKQRQQVEENYARLQTRYAEIIKACLAECVEFQRGLALLDGMADGVAQFLDDLTALQHMQTTHDTARQIMGTVGGAS